MTPPPRGGVSYKYSHCMIEFARSQVPRSPEPGALKLDAVPYCVEATGFYPTTFRRINQASAYWNCIGGHDGSAMVAHAECSEKSGYHGETKIRLYSPLQRQRAK